MAKRNTKAIHGLRSEKLNSAGRQGIGYYIPPTMDRNEWIKLRKLWNKKLQETNFDDIEQYSHDCSGHFSPFFVKTKHNNSIWGSSASAARQYSSETAEYYRRVGLFLHHADLWALFGRGKGGRRHYWLVWHMLRLLAKGATYQAIADFFGSSKCPPSLRGKKTYFFAYHHIERPKNKRAINKVMAEWWNKNREWLDE